MTNPNPQVILRMGSHSEKEYLAKMVGLMDGIVLAANLIEATPGASSSLLLKYGGAKVKKPFYIDPMTYAFGCYTDPSTSRWRTDLDWIKSDQKARGRAFKSSYRSLAAQLGGIFQDALGRERGISLPDLKTSVTVKATCRAVGRYQLERARAEFESDEEFAEYARELPPPATVFAPYFYIESGRDSVEWASMHLELAAMTAGMGFAVPTTSFICADSALLTNDQFMEVLARGLPKTGVSGVWFWFSKLGEDDAESSALDALRIFVEGLGEHGLTVINAHGGFFSLALSKHGMTGICHGIGYGEQKDVVPVLGQSTPTVNYYLPPLRKKFTVPRIMRSFEARHIESVPDFLEKVCDCAVCKGVLGEDLDAFGAFGEMRRATPSSMRPSQTPAAAKRCRFHFLLSRFREREWLKRTPLASVLNTMATNSADWALGDLLDYAHVERWRRALS